MRGHGQHIAVIDDEVDVAKVTEATLHSLGYDVSRFASAEDFFGEYSSMLLRFDLVITDQTMPQVTGLELAQRLRSEGHFMPIILASGYSKELREDVLGSIGRIEVIRKPYERRDLASLVHRMLSPNSIDSRHPLLPQT
jgi:FixJ family two-component response regulator